MAKPYIEKRDLREFLLAYHEDNGSTRDKRRAIKELIKEANDEYHLNIDPKEDL